jgi:flagellar protein FlaG
VSGAPPEQTLGAAVQDVKNYLQQLPSELQFGVDKGSGSFYFKVVNPATREVIRQVPSEEVLAMARKLREFANPKTASGVLMDKEG